MTPRRKRLLTPPTTPKSRGFWKRRRTASGRVLYSAPTPPSQGRNIRRMAAQAAGGVLGFIHGNVPGIIEGAHYAGEAFDYLQPVQQRKAGYTSTQKNNSMYGGKMNRPKPYDQSMESKILKQGYQLTAEVHGKVVDPYCSYIQHSTWNSVAMARTFGGSLLRKLFKIAGYEIADRIGTLPLYDIVNGSGFRIEYVIQNPSTSGQLPFTYDTVAGSTLDGILTGFAATFTGHIEAYLNNSDINMPYQLNLYSHDNNVALVNYRLCASIKIPNEVVTFHATSILKVQNRTKADTAGADNQDIDRVDTQPLICTNYVFRNEPKLKNISPGSAQHYLQGVTISGIKLFGSATFPGDVSFENRPNVAIFVNCNKKSSTVLQPGQMKTSYIKYQIKGKINNILPKQRYESNAGGNITGVKCTTEMIVFEELMRTAGTNPVQINYEREFKLGCILVTKKDNFALQPQLLTGEVNFP